MKLQCNKIFDIVTRAKRDGYSTVSAQGASRSGKTYNIMIWLVAQLLSRPRLSVSIVRATLPSLKRSVFRDFKDVLERINLWSDRNYNKTDGIYLFGNGSFAEFFSCDNEEKLKGSKRNILFINEANELKFSEWNQLQMRTTEFTIIDYNPSFSDEHWICSINRYDDVYHFITTYKDNPFLEQRVIDQIESLQHTNKSLWQIYGLGQQAQVEGLIFPEITVVDEIPDYAKREYLGVDFGFTNDPTAIVRVGVYADRLFIEELAYNTQMLTGDIVAVLKKHPRTKVISESADPRLIQEIYRAGINIHPVKKYPGSIMAGISKMLSYKICITKDSLNVIKEFKNYTYRQDKEGKWLNEPIDVYNHAIDAIRYVCLSELTQRQNAGIKIFN